MVEFVSCIYYFLYTFCMNSFIWVFVCVNRTLQNSLVYTISVISVFVSYTYVCYVLVYFVLHVYNCMHKRTIKYLVSCILVCVYINYICKLYIFVVKTLFPVLCTSLRKLREVNNKWIVNPYCAVWSAFIRQLLLQHFCLHIGQVHCKFFTLKVVGKPIFDLYLISQRYCMLSQKRYNDCPP